MLGGLPQNNLNGTSGWLCGCDASARKSSLYQWVGSAFKLHQSALLGCVSVSTAMPSSLKVRFAAIATPLIRSTSRRISDPRRASIGPIGQRCHQTEAAVTPRSRITASWDWPATSQQFNRAPELCLHCWSARTRRCWPAHPLHLGQAGRRGHLFWPLDTVFAGLRPLPALLMYSHQPGSRCRHLARCLPIVARVLASGWPPGLRPSR